MRARPTFKQSFRDNYTLKKGICQIFLRKIVKNLHYFALYPFFVILSRKTVKKSDMMPKFQVNCPEKVVIEMHCLCMQIVKLTYRVTYVILWLSFRTDVERFS